MLPSWVSAITIWPFIFFNDHSKLSDEKILNHERIHLKQQLELVLIFFYLIYGIEYIYYLYKYKNSFLAYKNISFEREAYANEHNPNYLSQRKNYSMWRSI